MATKTRADTVETFVQSISSDVEYEVRDKGDSGVELHFNTLVAKKNGEYLFLNRVFDSDLTDSDSLSGAVGRTMCPIHQEELQRRKEQYKDPERSPLAHIWEEQNDRNPENHVDEFVEWVEDEMKYGDPLVYDSSYSYEYGDTVRAMCEWSDDIGDDGYAIECVGGGRMFNSAFGEYDTVYRPDLLMLARYVENNGIDL